MSIASVKARIRAATRGPWCANQGFLGAWTVVSSAVPGYILQECGSADADFIAHAPTDLELALAVVEAARDLAAGLESARPSLEAAVDAFEAAP